MKVCITCQQSVEGKRAVRVREDRVIRAIRAIKKALRIAQMNELYVCEADIRKHLEHRRAFEKMLLFASILAGLIVVLLIGLLLISGRFDLWAMFSSLIIAGFVLVLPLFRYAPALEESPLVAAAQVAARLPAGAVPPGTPSAGPGPPPVPPLGRAGKKWKAGKKK
jgi:hypothetical protein